MQNDEGDGDGGSGADGDGDGSDDDGSVSNGMCLIQSEGRKNHINQAVKQNNTHSS